MLARLERFKRYPALARVGRQAGVAYLHVAMDRQGGVLSARIDRSSGSVVLDDEAMALVRRAAPLPAPPPEVVGDPLELTVPIEFSLAGR
ncbi:MAG: TonB family protein [Caulobacteraceae bacterium]